MIESQKETNNGDKESIKNKAEVLLKNTKLFDLITEDELSKTISGEIATVKAIFLSLCGIWVEDVQINTIVSSESSSGKSYVCKKIIEIFPSELVQYRTKITPEAFTYWHNSKSEPEWTWNGKICYIEDASQMVMDSPTFRVMSSEGSIATVVRNQQSIDIRINGKPCMLITTANTNPTKELLNRFNIINMDETEIQSHRILEKTAEFAENIFKVNYNPIVLESLRLLKRVPVIMPFAKKIVNHFPLDDIRVRRDFKRFLDLITASCALHQYQRERDYEGNFIAEEQDYELAKEAIISMQSNNTFGLTHQLKKAFQKCIEIYKLPEYEQGFSTKEIHAFAPIFSDRYWYTALAKLCQNKLLKTSLRKDTLSDKKITVYYPISKGIIKLPPFFMLDNDTSNCSNPSIGSNVNEANELNEQTTSKEGS